MFCRDADKLAETGLTFDLIISSPLDRAKTSAEIIAEKIKYEGGIICDPGFLERDFGELEGTKWTPDLKFEGPHNRLESVSEVCDRAKKALEKYTFPEDARVMIVSHGAMLTAVRTVLSDGKVSYEDRSIPIIQGNVLCCEKIHGKEPRFYVIL